MVQANLPIDNATLASISAPHTLKQERNKGPVAQVVGHSDSPPHQASACASSEVQHLHQSLNKPSPGTADLQPMDGEVSKATKTHESPTGLTTSKIFKPSEANSSSSPSLTLHLFWQTVAGTNQTPNEAGKASAKPAEITTPWSTNMAHPFQADSNPQPALASPVALQTVRLEQRELLRLATKSAIESARKLVTTLGLVVKSADDGKDNERELN